jgi:hypothetical protein
MMMLLHFSKKVQYEKKIKLFVVSISGIALLIFVAIIVVAKHFNCCCCDCFGNKLKKKYVRKMSATKMSSLKACS